MYSMFICALLVLLMLCCTFNVFIGVNSGVMLMNLTKMRAFQWEKYLAPIMKEYKLNIVWGDQDIINIIFHFHSGK